MHADDQLLQSLVDSGFDLGALKPRFAAIEIADLSLTPRFQERLAALLHLAHSLLTLRAASARIRSMSDLEAAASSAPNSVEKRRAATALLRASAAPLIPLRSPVLRGTEVPPVRSRPERPATPDPSIRTTPPPIPPPANPHLNPPPSPATLLARSSGTTPSDLSTPATPTPLFGGPPLHAEPSRAKPP